MNNLKIEKTSPDYLTKYKENYLKALPHSYDGMWEHFLALGDHYTINIDQEIAGYFVLNSDQKILQFSFFQNQYGAESFSFILEKMKIKGAFVTTGEVPYLSMALDHQQSVSVQSFLYEINQNKDFERPQLPEETKFRILRTTELNKAVSFAHETLGADESWLKSYYGNLLKRKELFGLLEGETLIATGERRKSYTQEKVADVGMVVSKKHRNKGLATNVLRTLVKMCVNEGLKPICSTEVENIGSQKAIERAGFISHHRILEITF